MPSLNSSAPRRRRNAVGSKLKAMGDHKAFMSRIKKTLYYGKLPSTERFSLPITELAAELYSEVKSGYSLDRLDLDEASALSRNACVSPCSLVLALLYLERLKTCNPDYLHRVAPSELFLVSMLVASKFLQDDGEDDDVLNEEWAASAGIDVKDVNQYERDFLQAIEWEVFVSERVFWKRLSGMERDVALKEGKRRGWFTYTDLDNLIDSVDLASLAHALITVSAICITSYTASVLTLIGSAFIVSQIPGSTLSLPAPILTPPVIPKAPSSNQDFSQSLQVTVTNSTDAKFILDALNSCANCSNISFKHTSHKINNPSYSVNDWTHTSDWITDLFISSWCWLNYNILNLSPLHDNLTGKDFEQDHTQEQFPMDRNFKFMFILNKSWMWESEDFWKDMKMWLQTTTNEQQTQFFQIPLTSHY